ncbi:MalY/PatB family protein [Companilactobacillus huachuanensis]|uniref:cysteine-S-conjugate beta-lyase n=1 Tax=Companilactobacillus huachuanensis TaxID=2559914 RepID=A0ABW1RMJ6_9LACO|nr:MalY/PatB family protein [Companilactobacillus huachuanensis]
MQFNFDKINDRRSANSFKWNVKEHELPMWVADMDIQTAPAIMDAMHKDVDRGIFGYQFVPESYYQAVASWYKTEHNFEPEIDWLVFSNGIMPTIGSILRHLTDVGDNILIQEPNYNSFFKTIENNGRHILNSELTYKNGKYNIDWKDLETKMLDPQTSAMIVCNPHNPSGQIWDKATLTKIGQMAIKHQVLIISDEIHGDLTMPGHDYIPFASLDSNVIANSISLVSPSKTFNLAILHAATMIIPDAQLRQRAERAVSVDGLNEPGILAIDASIAAYTEGHEWLHELRDYIQGNREFLEKFVQDNIPEIKVIPAESTYLAWIDCRKLTDRSDDFNQYLRDETGLYLAEGTKYRGNGNCFLRMNLATPRCNVEDGVERLRKGINKFVN